MISPYLHSNCFSEYSRKENHPLLSRNTMNPRSVGIFRNLCIWVCISMLFIQNSSCCFGSNSPYRGFGICLDVWNWKCPYERKCIDAWKVCDGWADCISGKDEVIILTCVKKLIQN